MRSHPHLKGLLAVVLVLLAYASMASQQTAIRALSESTQPEVGRSLLFSDLDGDGSSDSVRVSTGDLRLIIELQLSRTQTHHTVPFPATVTGQGSLWVRDFDSDGDVDLLWKSALPAYETFLWVNDGYGLFECICPPGRPDDRVVLVDASIRITPSHPSAFLSLPDHPPAPARTLAKHWGLPPPSLVRKLRQELLWKQFVVSPPFQRRGPPVRPMLFSC